MSSSRKNLIDKAFQKLDKTGDGKITLKDIKGVYNTRRHPEVLSGEKTEDEVLIKFLNTFESDASSPDVEPTGDGEVSVIACRKHILINNAFLGTPFIIHEATE